MKTSSHLRSVIFASISACLLMACSQENKEQRQGSYDDLEWTSSSEEALSHFEMGLKQQAVSNIQASRLHLDKAIEADPDFAMAYVYRSYTSGSAKEFADDSRQAMSLIDKVSDPEKIMVQVNQTYLENDNARRKQLFQDLTDLLPESAWSWANRGLDINNIDVNTARSYFEKAIALNPNYVEAYTYAGNSYLNIEPKDFSKSEAMFRKATEVEPSLAYSNINLGDALRAQNKLKESIGAYNKAVEMDKTLYTAYLKRGHVNCFLGNYAVAKHDYLRARDHDDSGNQAYTFEAEINLYADNVDAAIAELDAAMIKLDNSNLPPSRIKSGKSGIANELGWIAFHHQRLDDFTKYKALRNELAISSAEDIDTDAARLNTQSINAIWDGMELLLNGDTEAAMSKSEEYKELRKNDSSPNKLYLYHFFQGVVKYSQQDFAGAIESLQKANPNWLYRNYYLAKAMIDAGQTAEAKPIVDKVAKDNFNSVFYALTRNEMTKLNSSI